MKFLKKCLLFTVLTAVLAVSAAGCKKDEPAANTPSPQPVTTPVATPNPTPNPTPIPTQEPTQEPDSQSQGDSDEYAYYENSEYGFTIQYPAEWYVFEGAPTDEQIEAIQGVAGIEAVSQLVDLDFSTISVIWYDFSKNNVFFTPNSNINVMPEIGVTVDDMKMPEVQAELQAQYEYMYSLMLGNFKVINDIQGVELGGNFFLTFAFEGNIGEIEIAMLQAFTVHDNNLIVFSFSTLSTLFEETLPVYETMLSTLEF